MSFLPTDGSASQQAPNKPNGLVVVSLTANAPIGNVSNVGAPVAQTCVNTANGVMPQNAPVNPNVGLINGVPTAVSNGLPTGNAAQGLPGLGNAIANMLPTVVSNTTALAVPNGLPPAIPGQMSVVPGAYVSWIQFYLPYISRMFVYMCMFVCMSLQCAAAVLF